jgi:hypothetical protein
MMPATLRFSSSLPDREFFVPVRRSVTVRNDGAVGLRELNLRLSSTVGGRSPFTYSNNCPPTLSPGQSCRAQVRFAPRDSRAYTGTLAGFEGNDALASVNLEGSGAHPTTEPARLHVTITPNPVWFNPPETVREVVAPLAQIVFIRSDGTTGLRRLTVRLGSGGVVQGPFRILSRCSAILDLGRSCPVQVRFSPRASQQYDGNLNVFEGSLQLASVDLYGNGSLPSQPHHGGVGTSVGSTDLPTPGHTMDGPPTDPRSAHLGTGQTSGSRQSSSMQTGNSATKVLGRAIRATADNTRNRSQLPAPKAPPRNSPGKIPQRSAKTVPPPSTPLK